AKLCYTLALGFHIAVALLHHVGSAAMVCGVMDNLLPTLHALKGFAPVRYYAHYTGTGIGSGYFAPRVGSSFHVQATVTYRDGTTQRCVAYPWTTRAAQLRYTAFCQLFQEFANRNAANGHAYEQAVARRIGMHMARPLLSADAEALVITVSVHRPPTLAQYCRGTRAVFSEVYHDTVAVGTLSLLP